MTTIKDYFENAELAMAAYAELDASMNGLPSYREALANESGAGMSPVQAERFAAAYEIVDQITDPVSGLSATAFRRGGEVFLAVRGTESLLAVMDVITDIGILEGIGAPGQLNALEGFYQGLRAGGKISATDRVVVSGHSLGGFLAQMFAVNHAGEIAEALTYNAPGLGGIAAQILDLMGVVESNVPLAAIANIRGAGLSPIASLGTLLGDVQETFIEQSGNPFRNHSIATLTDALAVYELLAVIDPAKTAEQLLTAGTGVLKAASPVAETSLEAVVNALVDLFGAGATVAVGDRDKLYETLSALRTALTDGTSGALKPQYQGLSLVDLSGMTADQLDSAAQTSLAHRYALTHLNAYALTGNDGIYTPHNNFGALERYDEATGSGTLTTKHLEDRARFLEGLLKANVEDTSTLFDGGTSEQVVFTDTGLGVTLGLNVVVGSPDSLLGSQVVFGANGRSNVLAGGDREDHLYGGDGIDALRGQGGADYLEGQADDDSLLGGAGADVYRGGKGADTLIDAGTDGAIDEYRIEQGGGTDTVVDEDGAGKVLFLGRDLGGVSATQVYAFGDNERLYRDAEGYTYLYSGSPGKAGRLSISKPGEEEGVILQRFTSGEFGITLTDTPLPETVAGPAGTGMDDDSSSTQPGHGETLIADAPNEEVHGEAGNDRLVLAANLTRGYGGAGDDILTNGEGMQWLYGEAGRDVLNASGGTDELKDGEGMDVYRIDAGDGNDVLISVSGSAGHLRKAA